MSNILPPVFIKELRAVIADTEQLLHATAGHADAKILRARAHTERSLERARKQLRTAEQRTMDRLRLAARATGRYVHEQPWKTMAVAAAGAAFLSAILSRRR